MLISGIKKTTLLDYPWKVAAIIFTPWCNLRCKFCHNSEFVLPEKIKEIKDYIPEEVFFNFLKTKIGLIDWVVICGGEPTLQKDLLEFCKKIKDLWFLVKLDTNWRDPLLLENLIKNKLVDYIAMDIKGDFDDLNDLIWWDFKSNVGNYLKSVNTLLKWEIEYEFRTTLIKEYHTKDIFLEILKLIKGTKNYYLQNYKGWNTLDKDFKGKSFSSLELKEFKELSEKYGVPCKIRI